MSKAFVGMPKFQTGAKQALGDSQLRTNLGHATTTIRAKREKAVGELPDWEDLRLAGAAIKDEVGAHLDHYLELFERQFTAAGGHVHWARDAAEANRIVTDLVRATGESEVVKVKSMVTVEIALNEALAEAGITAHETDLAELIVQLADDLPSHILVPAIHRSRGEIREIFLEHMPGVTPELSDEPADLAGQARTYLREKFMQAKVAISGANFMVAETGTLVVVESEGNGRMCLTLPETLISVVGIEKVLPTWRDLEVFLQLLPRSSTAERMNPYTTMWTGAHGWGQGSDGQGSDDQGSDGPRTVHVVLLDNGRTRVLADPVGRQALRCIRCSACLNSCPVYERVGGRAYGSVYPGPIGAILNPLLNGVEAGPVERSLPYASSLCGRCFEVCPVRIDIPDVLVHLRGQVVASHQNGRGEALALGAVGWVFGSARRLRMAERGLSLAHRLLGQRTAIGPIPLPFWATAWSQARDVPMPPAESFRQWWHSTRGDEEPKGWQR
ncbi:MAG: lactate utilization protein [Kineosporiaceae bacterium]|nr:lactate utilization protein [Kineosporiaceae bacterium]